MKVAVSLIAGALVALLATGCAHTRQHGDTLTRLSAAETAAASAQARADEAYRDAAEALAVAQRAQKSADEANERALRMLERLSSN